MMYHITVQRQQVSVYFGSRLDFSIISLEKKIGQNGRQKLRPKHPNTSGPTGAIRLKLRLYTFYNTFNHWSKIQDLARFNLITALIQKSQKKFRR